MTTPTKAEMIQAVYDFINRAQPGEYLVTSVLTFCFTTPIAAAAIKKAHADGLITMVRRGLWEKVGA